MPGTRHRRTARAAGPNTAGGSRVGAALRAGARWRARHDRSGARRLSIRQDRRMPAEQETPCAWTGLTPASGRLLVASTTLNEPTFARTVVYLLEHDGDGTVGVVLNRPSHTPVGQVLPDWQDAVSEPSVIFGGGPVMPDGALCLAQLKGRHAGDGPGGRRV